jgi:hypothetical protein
MKLVLSALTFSLMASVAAAEIIDLQATYSVPTLNTEELTMNSFELKNYQVETFADGGAVMRFEMPADMVGADGQKHELKLVGKTSATTKILSSPSAKAVCEGPWINMQCSIGFLKLKMDKNSLADELAVKYPEAEAQQRYNLLMRFNNDPIGTVKVVKPSAPSAQ